MALAWRPCTEHWPIMTRLLCWWLWTVLERLESTTNRADFVSWWMWFNGSPGRKCSVVLSRMHQLLPSSVLTFTKIRNRPRLIAVCKRSFRMRYDYEIRQFWRQVLASSCADVIGRRHRVSENKFWGKSIELVDIECVLGDVSRVQILPL